MKSILTFSLLCFSFCVGAQNVERLNRLAKSDSLFAKGVELYKANKYKEAIPFFTEADRIDKTVLDSTSNRRDYSAMWLGSCYYKLENIIEAKKYSESYYSVEPVDRRLTFKSDSLSAIGIHFYQQKDYKQALFYFEQCGEIEKKIVGNKSIWYANTLLNIAESYYGICNYRETIRFGTEALNVIEKVLGKNHSNYATVLNNLAECNSLLGNYQEAIRLETEALTIIEKVSGRNHSDYATVLGNLAEYNSSLENYQEAIRLETEALAIRERVFGKSHPDYATSLNNLAEYNSFIGNYQEAIRLETEALTIRERVFGKSHPDYATSLNNLAGYNSSIGNYQEAIRLETEALAIRERVFGKSHPDYATSLNNLAEYNSFIGNYQEAIRLETEALAIRERVFGKSHPDYATSLNNLAEYNSFIGNYQEAIRLGTEALTITENTLGRNHLNCATALNDLAEYNSSMGNYQEAIHLETEALTIRGKILGKNHPVYATSLNNLALYNSFIGNYQEAIRLGTEALTVQERVLGKSHPDYATSLNNLALYNSSMGNCQEAIRFGTEALPIIEKALGQNHPSYATCLSNLAGYNSSMGNYQEAIRLGTEALTVRERVLGKSHPDYATSLNNLALYNFSMGNYREAIRLNTESLNIIEKALGQNHPSYATCLSNLAGYNFLLENYQEAIHLETEALTVRRKILGQNHPDYTISLGNLSCFYFKSKDYKKAETLLSSYVNITSRLIRSNFSWLTQNERALYWDKYKNEYLYSIPQFDYSACGDTAYTKMDYNAQLLAKGLLLNSEMEFRNLIQKQEKNKGLIAQYEEWRGLKVQINKLYTRSDSVSISYRKIQEEKADNLERTLLRDSKAFGDYTRDLTIQWRNVQSALGLRDMAIEYTSFPMSKDSIMYCALLIKKNMAAPALVPLFEKKELDKLQISPTCDFLTALTYDSEENHNLIYNSKKLGQLVWGKILPFLSDVEHIYFSPSGVFYQLGIENLPLADGKTVSDHFAVYRLSSTRELVRGSTVSLNNKVDLYGGLQYNEEPQIMTEMSHKNRRDLEFSDNLIFALDNTLPLYKIENTYSGAKEDSTQAVRSAIEVNELPYTKKEVMEINTELSQPNTKNVVHTTIYTGVEGNEESFKALSGTHPKIIHIATHGFFLPQSKAEEYNDKRSFLMGFKEQQKKAEVDFSLSRSGLLMAGGKKAWLGEAIPDSIDDGILTAREIAHMDLNGTDLVVLSACETGLGDVSGEGVSGLQRGFKKAGVKTLIMSLWKVDDKATQMMMTRFYGNLMKGQTKRTAFLNAQKYLKEYKIIEAKFDGMKKEIIQGKKEEQQQQEGEKEVIHPYAFPQYWAAFILLDGIN